MILLGENKPVKTLDQDSKNPSATLNAIIIEDEHNSMLFIQHLLNKNYPQINIIAKLTTLKDSLDFINNNKLTIDIAFLDIMMPEGTIFQMLDQLERIPFHIIFTTAHDTFAVQAFRYSALDYLLKPINPEDLIKTVDKLLHSKPQFITEQIEVFNEHYQHPNDFDKFILKDAKGIYSVNIKELIRCHGENNYTRFFFKDGSIIFVCQTLKTYEMLLKKLHFYRIHRSYMINTNYLKQYVDGYVILEDGTKLIVAKRRRAAFKDYLNSLNNRFLK